MQFLLLNAVDALALSIFLCFLVVFRNYLDDKVPLIRLDPHIGL